MNPITDPFSFHVGDTHFLLTNSYVVKNGEVIAEGKVFPFNIIHGQKAWIIVHVNDYVPPIYITTDEVTTVPEGQEIFEGTYYPPKFTYTVLFSRNNTPREMKVYAVDPLHAEELCRFAKGNEVEVTNVFRSKVS